MNAVPADDAFPTIATTRGWLSNGVGRPLVANGGDGNDVFAVYHNLAPVTLNGDNNNDLFTIRAFALAQTQNGDIVWLDQPNRIAQPLLVGNQVGPSSTTPSRRTAAPGSTRPSRSGRVRRSRGGRHKRCLQRRADRELREDRGPRDRRHGGRRHDRRDRYGCGTRDAGDRRARQRHRRRRRRRLCGRRHEEQHDLPQGGASPERAERPARRRGRRERGGPQPLAAVVAPGCEGRPALQHRRAARRSAAGRCPNTYDDSQVAGPGTLAQTGVAGFGGRPFHFARPFGEPTDVLGGI